MTFNVCNTVRTRVTRHEAPTLPVFSNKADVRISQPGVMTIRLICNFATLLTSMKVKFLTLAVCALALSACKDDPPPVVITVPEPEIPDSRIDQYYYVQFAWGKTSQKDTHTYEVPDDTSSWDLEKDYMNIALDIRNEAVLDTANADDLDEGDPIPKDGWHYAPTSFFYPRKYVEYMKDPSGDAEAYAEAYQNLFSISFPWILKGPADTIQFWDIEDYLENPSIVKGNIPWGRVGNNVFEDSLWNNDAYTGAVITYVDESGEMWRSDNHPTFQPFGYFVIKSIITNDRDKETYSIIEGECAARLYNSIGYYKDLRGGKFRMKILTDIELSPQPE